MNDAPSEEICAQRLARGVASRSTVPFHMPLAPLSSSEGSDDRRSNSVKCFAAAQEGQ